MFDYIVVGAGFGGATAANLLAEKGKKVLLLEKRDTIGGNMYDYKDESGSFVHMYGPHLFHTSMDNVYQYITKFSEFYTYKHKVFGEIDGQIVPIPFNFESLEKVFPKQEAQKYSEILKKTYPDKHKITINELRKSDDSLVKQLAEYVYEKVFLNYTKKQWGVSDPSELDGLVTDRVPVCLSYENFYFTDKYQVMPKNGYTKLFENMLTHKNIQIKLGTDAIDCLAVDYTANQIYFEGKPYSGKVVYTGQIDELFAYEFGKLEYRTVDFKFENHKVNKFQSNSVINYPNAHNYTRITEFKHFMEEFPTTDSTTIMYEYPRAHSLCDEPYYPVPKAKNAETYNKYLEVAKKVDNIYFLGRLAEYKYYNMDQIIDKAIKLIESIED